MCVTLPGVSHFPGQPRPCEAGGCDDYPVRPVATDSDADSPIPPPRSLFRYVFDVVEQRSTMALFTARADGGSATPAPQDFCKACLWQVIDASIDFRDPNPN